jgi:hypothetical protein
LRADAIQAQVDAGAGGQVGLNRICPGVLNCVRPDFINQV